jgi:hypothetical protein
VAGDEPPVPGEDRGWDDEPVGLQRSRPELGQGGEHGRVGPVQRRRRVLSAKDRVLVTQDQDLYILAALVRARRSNQPTMRQNTR